MTTIPQALASLYAEPNFIVPPSDPFAPPSLFGMKIIESPDHPRYTLPEEVIQGVPWPPGFREKINRWSVSYLGTVNYLPRGTVYMIANRYAVMRPSDVVKLANCC